MSTTAHPPCSAADRDSVQPSARPLFPSGQGMTILWITWFSLQQGACMPRPNTVTLDDSPAPATDSAPDSPPDSPPNDTATHTGDTATHTGQPRALIQLTVDLYEWGTSELMTWAGEVPSSGIDVNMGTDGPHQYRILWSDIDGAPSLTADGPPTEFVGGGFQVGAFFVYEGATPNMDAYGTRINGSVRIVVVQ